MVEGPSGLLAVHEDRDRPVFEASRNRLRWSNGSEAYIYSAESAESLRGPQFGAAWCDELAKWRNGQMAWDMLQFSLRLGERPRVVVTTTPRPVPILKSLMADEQTVMSQVSTASNASNLAPTFVAEMRRRYDGTALGRQELYGELIEDDSGQLWRRDWIAETRLQEPPALLRRVVAVDPPVTAKQTSDACGIVVAGLAADGRGVVIADRSIQGREPTQWARAAVAAYKDFAADRIVAEVNQGGDLVRTIINQIEPGVPVRNVRATLGKWLRPEPVRSRVRSSSVVP